MAESNPTLAEALTGLTERRMRKPEAFNEGATEDDILKANAALPYPIPTVWQEVLKFSNGSLLANIEWPSASQISPPNEDWMEHIQEASPTGSLIIGWTPSGDVICLDVAKQTASGDCPTVWTNHEGEPDMWPNIPAMLLFMIAQDKLDDGITL